LIDFITHNDKKKKMFSLVNLNVKDNYLLIYFFFFFFFKKFQFALQPLVCRHGIRNWSQRLAWMNSGSQWALSPLLEQLQSFDRMRSIQEWRWLELIEGPIQRNKVQSVLYRW